MIQFKNNYCCVFESALFKTTSTVLWTNDLVLVVDPNWLPHEIDKIRQFTDSIKENRPVFLLFTHSDYDHILGYGAFPDAKVIASKAFVGNATKNSVLDQIEKFDHDYYIDRPYQMVYPEVDIIVEKSGQKFMVGDTELNFYLAPGHNPDGIFTFIKQFGIWIVGDYLSDVEFPYIYHSCHAYEQSLILAKKILKNWQPKLMIPGHGKATTSQEEMELRIEESFEYLNLLKKSAMEQLTFPETFLWNRYNYARSMKLFHDNNLALAKKEFGR